MYSTGMWMRNSTMSSEGPKPKPTAPGYGDQGPAGGGREEQPDAATETEKEPESPDDPGGRAVTR